MNKERPKAERITEVIANMEEDIEKLKKKQTIVQRLLLFQGAIILLLCKGRKEKI